MRLGDFCTLSNIRWSFTSASNSGFNSCRDIPYAMANYWGKPRYSPSKRPARFIEVYQVYMCLSRSWKKCQQGTPSYGLPELQRDIMNVIVCALPSACLETRSRNQLFIDCRNSQEISNGNCSEPKSRKFRLDSDSTSRGNSRAMAPRDERNHAT